jgi:hypothetical protein
MNNKERIKKLEESYLSEDEILSYKGLARLIENVISSKNLIALQERIDADQRTITPDEDINISLPVVRISEAWGRSDNSDRSIIESFTKRIGGETLEQKLLNINQVLTGQQKVVSVSQLLSSMMVCEILSTILKDFTESAGGFIFEGFLAGLFGGKSVQITTAADIEGMDAAGKPITDVILGDRHYSLKLLGPSTGVKGSFKNMVNHFKSLGPGGHIVYLDARRIGGTEGLEFGEFTITLENFLDVFFTPFAKIKKKTTQIRTARQLSNALEKYGDRIFKIKSTGRVGRATVFTPDTIQQVDPETLASIAPFVVSYSEESFQGSTKAKQLFGSGRQFNDVADAISKYDAQDASTAAAVFAALEATPGYKKSRQFEFTKNQAESISNFKHVGTLMIGEESMKSVWLKYAKVLQEVINPIYSNLQEFTNNVNAYLLGEGEADRKGRGVQAVSDAEQLATVTSKVVEKVTPEEPKP